MFNTGEKDKENVAEERLRQLQAEALRASADRVAKQSQFELLKNATPDSLPEVIDDKTLTDYQSKLTDLRRQIADLSFNLMPNHPKIQRLQLQVDLVEAALKKSRSDILARIGNDYQAARHREELLN